MVEALMCLNTTSSILKTPRTSSRKSPGVMPANQIEAYSWTLFRDSLASHPRLPYERAPQAHCPKVYSITQHGMSPHFRKASEGKCENIKSDSHRRAKVGIEMFMYSLEFSPSELYAYSLCSLLKRATACSVSSEFTNNTQWHITELYTALDSG